MARAAPVLLLSLLAGCITPPAIAKAGGGAVFLDRMPPGSEAVAVAVTDDEALRGAWVPAEPGAPVVVHLLGSGGSVSAGYAPALFWALRDRGFASLAVDYRGVGPSDGGRSVDHLRADAVAAHAEALRRAGAPGRVVVRGTSIGTLAAGALLEEGARPGAVVLFAPVRGETVARNWLYWHWWDAFAFLVAPFVRSATEVDLVAALRGAEAPLLVVVPERDRLLPPDETELVAAAVRAAGGRFVRIEDAGHLGVAVRAFDVVPEEDALYAEPFPALPPVGARVDAVLAAVPADARAALAGAGRGRLEELARRRRHEPPALAGALVLAGSGGAARDRYLLPWLRGRGRAALDGLPFEALRALVDFDDPAGALDLRELYHFTELAGEIAAPEDAVALVRAQGLAGKATYEADVLGGLAVFGPLARGTISVSAETAPEDAPARLRLPPEQSLRQAVRLALKAAFFPDRVADGGGLEVWEGGGWRPLPLE